MASRVLKNMTFVAGALAVALAMPAVAQDAAKPAPCGPKGSHPLLERMTAAFHLTCDQKFQIEPFLKDEHMITIPLINFGAFTPEEKTAFMGKVKIAARNQIKPLLTPEQQKLMDKDSELASNGSGNAKGDSWETKKRARSRVMANKDGGASSGDTEVNKTSTHPKKPVQIASAFEGEEALCDGVSKYPAFSADQKREMMLEVKKAARREGAPQLTPEQEKKIDADIQKLTDKKS